MISSSPGGYSVTAISVERTRSTNALPLGPDERHSHAHRRAGKRPRGRAQRAVPSARRRAPDDRHAEDGGCDLLRSTIRRILYSGSGESRRPTAQVSAGNVGMVPRAGEFLSGVEPPATLPWLAEADIDFYVGEFARTGFRGGLNWYRNIDRNWELLAPWAG